MSDIIMCTSETCPYRDTCYRKMVKSNDKNQSYFNFEYTCNENSSFNSYIRC